MLSGVDEHVIRHINFPRVTVPIRLGKDWKASRHQQPFRPSICGVSMMLYWRHSPRHEADEAFSTAPGSVMNASAYARLTECRITMFNIFDIDRTERRLRLL
jgi:hypothetical protein